MVQLDSISKMEEKKVLDRLQRQCARAEYCSHDMLLKARKLMPEDEGAAQRIVEKLLKEKYVDDSRYAGIYAREKARLNGWGPGKIAYQLKLKHIDKEIIDSAIEEAAGPEAFEKLCSVMQNKFRSLKAEQLDYPTKIKLLRFGAAKGYSIDEIEKALNRLSKS